MMSDKPKKPSAADSPTGVMQRPTPEEIKQRGQESPQPPTSLPDFDAGEAITGVYSIVTEGEDNAKDADDNPTKSASAQG